MRWCLIASSWRRPLRNPVVVALLLLIVAHPAIVTAASGSSALSGADSLLLALVLGAGAIGNDVSSGSLLLTLSRPVARWELVASTWVGITTLASAIATLQAAIVVVVGHALGVPDLPTIAGLPELAMERLAPVAGGAASMLLFGCLLPGAWGVGAWAFSLLAPFALAELLGNTEAQVGIATMFARTFVYVILETDRAFAHDRIAWSEITQYIFGVLVCLTLATIALNWRELPYNR